MSIETLKAGQAELQAKVDNTGGVLKSKLSQIQGVFTALDPETFEGADLQGSINGITQFRDDIAAIDITGAWPGASAAIHQDITDFCNRMLDDLNDILSRRG